LDRLPLIRWTLFRLSADEHILTHREHHLLHDGWSFAVLVGELLRLYQAHLEGRPSPLPPLRLRLGDFAHAEREWMRGPAAERQLAYWRRQLADCPQSLELPYDFTRPARPSYRGDAFRLDLPQDLVRSLRALARENGVTLFATMLGVFAVLLARYSDQRELCIGSGVAHRRRPEIEGMVGMMLNNVVLRLDLTQEVPLEIFLRQVQRVVLEALSNQDVPFDRVVRLVRSGAGPAAASAVCPVFFSSYDGPIPQVPIGGLTVDVEAGLANGSAKFDLNVIVVSQPQDGFVPPAGAAVTAERVTLIWEYSSDLFARATVERMARHYVSLLRSSAGDARRAWCDLELASDGESLSLAQAAPGSASYRPDASIVELWEEQVARSPDDVAVRALDGAWTYRELDVTANRLAYLLQDRGVRPEDVVGFCLPRGRAAIASMLGILKASAAYLPLDLRQPKRRIAWLAADAGIRCVLTDGDSLPRLDECASLERLCLDELAGELHRYPEASPASVSTAESLAYVMFTSGSTGPPKGVEILHRGVVRLLFGVDYVRLGRQTRILQLAPLSFDASTFEIWAALLHGGTLIIHPEDVPDAGSLGRAIAQEGVNTMWLNASLFNVIVDQQPAVLAPLEQLLIGGEALSVEHVRRAYRHLPRTQIINGYGPTENTTFSCCFAIPRDLPPSARSVPLGRPIAHSSAYVLDQRLRPLPWGLIGEIYLGGDGVARGYRSRPALTATHFLPDPFASRPAARLYRSGDFGRFRPDGTLEFRGRRDDQVKIRGCRIEPAEVEWALHRLPGVRQTAVIAQREDPASTRLVAYVVPEPGVALEPGQLRIEARRELPPQLVPQEFVVLDALPLSHHGKLDRAALPAPPAVRTAAWPPVPPRNAREEIVAGVMAEVLGVNEVGIEDQFFDMGGHSLLGLDLLERLSRVFGVEIPVRALIENPTAAGLAALIAERDRPKRPSLEPEWSRRSLVRIKPGGSREPLFFTPGGDGAEGSLLVYAKLARFLGAERPFYALRARGINDDAAPHRTVEEMAADYLAEVKQVQPQGPYFFSGECVGGVIAYEMARQALVRGDDIGLVVLLDSRPPRYASYLRHWLRYLSSRARIRLDRTLGPLSPDPTGGPAAAGVGPAARRDRIVARRWLDNLLPYDAREAPPTIELAWVEYQRTLLRYRARPYRGRMALLLSEQYAAKGVGREWARLVEGGLDVYRAPGDHDSYIRLHARATAGILAGCLDRARARA
jgi:amino acid adenylation domain-containing protein